MIRYIAVFAAAVLAALVGFAGYVARLPANYSVFRTTTIVAPPQAIFPHVNDFRKWQIWSPWARKDPDAKTAYSGPESGKGATFEWSGNADVGEGGMIIIDSIPNQRVKIALTFTRPFTAANEVALDLKPDGNATQVTWSTAGEMGFVARAFGVLMGLDMDQMIGSDYEIGLANLKALVEARPKS